MHDGKPVRVWMNIGFQWYYVDLKNFTLLDDGSGVVEGINLKTGDEVKVKEWIFIEPMDNEKKPVKIVEKKNPLKRDDA